MTQKYPEKYYDVPSFLPVFCTGKVPLFRFSAFPLFYFSGLSGMPVVQRRTIAACASIILCVLSCQSCTRSLPACAPAPGSGLKLISRTILNQPCQRSRSASAQCCNCSRPLLASSCSSSGVPLALARVSVHCRTHSARASMVSFTEDCQASTVFVQSSRVGVPPNRRKVSSQSLSSFCCDSAQVFNRPSSVFLSLIDPFSFHRSRVRNSAIVLFVCQSSSRDSSSPSSRMQIWATAAALSSERTKLGFTICAR